MGLLLRHLWLVARVGSRHLGVGRGGLQAAALLAAGGLAAGTATLLVVLAVMNGFQLGFIENIVEIGSYHVRVAPGEQSAGASAATADREAFAAQLAGVDGVSAAVPFAELPALISPSGARPGASRGLVLRVVPPDVRRLDAGFARRVRMVAGEFAVQEPGSAVVGAELASWLGVLPGDTVAVVTLDGAAGGGAGLQPRHVELVVTGIFRSGLYEYDLSWAFVGPATLRAAAPRTPFVYGIKLANRFRDTAAQTALAAALAAVDPAAGVESWRVYNRALFAALRVEKLLLTAILGLVFLVVAYNVLQGLRRRVLERGMEIGLLRAMGAPPWVVRAVFIWEGALLGILGAGAGTALGLLMAYNLDGVFGLLETIANAALALAALVPGIGAAAAPVELFSPQTFYLVEVPSRLVFSEVLLVAGFAAAAPAASGLLAAARAARVAAAAALRAE
ncbi:MAG: ABC transporter permease [Spirochaetaceae bacterium]|nr:ABC transporter permease [Spirochaetaceae bacterium]